MEKKNTLLLTVIAIATLLVAVIGATYAYFASTVDTDNNIPVNVQTANGTGTLTSYSGNSIHFNVTAGQMLQSAANNEAITIAEGESDLSNLSVELEATGQEVNCSYDVVWEWDAGTNTYAGYGEAGADATAQNYMKTKELAAGDKELTITLYQGNLNQSQLASATVLKEETNMDFTITDGHYVLYSATGDNKISTDGVTKGEHNYTAKVKFYNSTVDQSIQEGKVFAGKIKIANVKC